jgi:hypothetical protein
MIRKQIYLRSDQDELLKREAAKLGISAAELIRRRVQGVPGGISRPTRREAWQSEVDFIKERARLLPDLKGKRSWTRDELYEERLGRFSARH